LPFGPGGSVSWSPSTCTTGIRTGPKRSCCDMRPDLTGGRGITPAGLVVNSDAFSSCMKKRSRPGDWAGSLDPVVGDGEGGDSTGFSPPTARLPGRPLSEFLNLRRLPSADADSHLTEPTAMLRSSSIDTQTPEFRIDCCFR